VNENSQLLAATVVGAIIGGVAGYLFFTDHGRQLRRRVEPILDEFATELSSFRVTLQKAAGVANEGWRLLNEAAGDGEGRQASRYAGARSASPF